MGEVIFVISVGISLACLASVVILFFYPKFFSTIWYWLDGSRTTHYLRNPNSPKQSEVKTTEQKLRIAAERIVGFNPGIRIEINQGSFRRRSRIYGQSYPPNWEITEVYWGGDSIELTGRIKLSIEKALRMVNAYSSLQAMLDRIAELEHQVTNLEGLVRLKDGQIAGWVEIADSRNEQIFKLKADLDAANALTDPKLRRALKVSELRRQSLWASVKALLVVVNADRSRYRSPAAANIHKCLDAIDRWAAREIRLAPTPHMIRQWRDRVFFALLS